MSTEQPQVVSDDPTVPESSAPPAKADPAAETSTVTKPADEAPHQRPKPESEPASPAGGKADSKPEPAAPAETKAGGKSEAAAPAELAAPTDSAPVKEAPAKEDPAKEEEPAKAGDKDTKGEPGKDADPKHADPKDRDPKDGDAKGSDTKGGDTKVETKVKEEPPRDPFAAFAPEPVRRPNRRQRIGRALGRFMAHEWTLATIGSIVLAVLMTWPTLRYPLHTLPQDFHDPALQAWQMAWTGHILLTDPAQLWNSNTFFPEPLSFAFSDTLLGYAPAGMLGDGPHAAILRYNIIFVLAHALATLGAYALVRQLGAGRTGAVVAGVAYTFAPWMLAQAGHLHIVSNGGIPLALAMLARGHGYSFAHGYRDDRRHAGWAFAGWLVAAWQLSLGFGIGLVFAYVLGALALAALFTWYWRKAWRWTVKRRFGGRLVVADILGGLAFAATGALLSLPYFDVAHQHPEATRRVQDLEAYAPPLSGFFIAPPESLIWGNLHENAREGLRWAPEMAVLPGYVLYALAFAGIFFSVWRLRHRLLLVAGVLVTGILAMGPNFFGGKYTYLPLFNNLPGWDGLRTPGRLMLWTTLLLGILAAGAVSALVRRVNDIATLRVTRRPGVLLRLVTLVPLLLVLAEGLNTTPHPAVPPQPEVMRTEAGPLIVLPFNLTYEQTVMLWSTTRFQPVVNGGSGFTPVRQERTREAAETFPDQASVDYLRELGVKTVVMLRDELSGTPWQATANLPVDSLGIQREEIGDTIVFRL